MSKPRHETDVLAVRQAVVDAAVARADIALQIVAFARFLFRLFGWLLFFPRQYFRRDVQHRVDAVFDARAGGGHNAVDVQPHGVLRTRLERLHAAALRRDVGLRRTLRNGLDDRGFLGNDNQFLLNFVLQIEIEHFFQHGAGRRILERA